MFVMNTSRLTPLSKTLVGSKTYWRCLCACGAETLVRQDRLRSGKTKSCGCLQQENNTPKPKHAVGRRGNFKYTEPYASPKHPLKWLYCRWSGMWGRCTDDKSKSYKHYGGRSIKVCDRWKDFENFLADMGVPEDRKLSLDRIDNDGNYEPGNCRWATMKQQVENRRAFKWSAEAKARVQESRACLPGTHVPDDWLDGLIPK